MTDAIWAALIGTISSLVMAFITYGITTEKVRKLQEEMKEVREEIHDSQTEMKQEQSRFVTLQHFDAVVNPLRQTLDNVQTDIKVLLRLVGSDKK